MIKVDESDPVGELEPSFPFKDIKIRRGVDMKEHYELQSEIGRGKFGTVFKCREKATGLMLAAKFVGIAHKQDRRNVEREVEIMCELQHPRLIQLYDAFEANNAMCFILELVEGGELFERVIGDDFVLTEKAVTIFMRQICEGVQFIHSKNILHLDLKPENILCLTKTGNRIKIIDFGLARKFNPENKLQVLFGTPEFVAPEVVNFDAIGFGTDMWSVGVICYVLLSGLSPFMGETDVETMANVTIAQYDFDDEAFDSISNDAKDFIKKLLIKDHKSRPSATECLSHRWLQKKRPKKMARKSSSKLLVKQPAAEVVIVKPEPSQPPGNRSHDASPSLDVSKDNLKEFFSKSRSLSPVDVAVMAAAPTLAQLRIHNDSESSLESQGCDKNDGGQGSVTVHLLGAHETDGVPLLLKTSGVQQQEVEKQTSPARHIRPSSGVQQLTASGQQRQNDQPETRITSSSVTSGLAAVEAPPPGQEVTGDQRGVWLDTNHNNSLLRRSSDVSYMFSSFRTTTTTMSTSGFLGAPELQGLSERLQHLQSIFDDRDRPAVEVGGGGGSLHKLLLNRQHLTAAAADRKPKFKISQMNRDVPFGSPPPASNLLYYMTSSSTSSSCRSAPHSKRTSPEHETISTKEMLLKLFYGGGADKAPESKVST